jgi:hypothetical protein
VLYCALLFSTLLWKTDLPNVFLATVAALFACSDGAVCCEYCCFAMAPPEQRGDQRDRRETPPPGGLLFASTWAGKVRGKCALIILCSILFAVALSTLCVTGGQAGDCGAAVATIATKDVFVW